MKSGFRLQACERAYGKEIVDRLEQMQSKHVRLEGYGDNPFQYKFLPQFQKPSYKIDKYYTWYYERWANLRNERRQRNSNYKNNHEVKRESRNTRFSNSSKKDLVEENKRQKEERNDRKRRNASLKGGICFSKSSDVDSQLDVASMSNGRSKMCKEIDTVSRKTDSENGKDENSNHRKLQSKTDGNCSDDLKSRRSSCDVPPVNRNSTKGYRNSDFAFNQKISEGVDVSSFDGKSEASKKEARSFRNDSESCQTSEIRKDNSLQAKRHVLSAVENKETDIKKARCNFSESEKDSSHERWSHSEVLSHVGISKLSSTGIEHESCNVIALENSWKLGTTEKTSGILSLETAKHVCETVDSKILETGITSSDNHCSGSKGQFSEKFEKEEELSPKQSKTREAVVSQQSYMLKPVALALCIEDVVKSDIKEDVETEEGELVEDLPDKPTHQTNLCREIRNESSNQNLNLNSSVGLEKDLSKSNLEEKPKTCYSAISVEEPASKFEKKKDDLKGHRCDRKRKKSPRRDSQDRSRRKRSKSRSHERKRRKSRSRSRERKRHRREDSLGKDRHKSPENSRKHSPGRGRRSSPRRSKHTYAEIVEDYQKKRLKSKNPCRSRHKYLQRERTVSRLRDRHNDAKSKRGEVCRSEKVKDLRPEQNFNQRKPKKDDYCAIDDNFHTKLAKRFEKDRMMQSEEKSNDNETGRPESGASKEVNNVNFVHDSCPESNLRNTENEVIGSVDDVPCISKSCIIEDKDDQVESVSRNCNETINNSLNSNSCGVSKTTECGNNGIEESKQSSREEKAVNMRTDTTSNIFCAQLNPSFGQSSVRNVSSESVNNNSENADCQKIVPTVNANEFLSISETAVTDNVPNSLPILDSLINTANSIIRESFSDARMTEHAIEASLNDMLESGESVHGEIALRVTKSQSESRVLGSNKNKSGLRKQSEELIQKKEIFHCGKILGEKRKRQDENDNEIYDSESDKENCGSSRCLTPKSKSFLTQKSQNFQRSPLLTMPNAGSSRSESNDVLSKILNQMEGIGQAQKSSETKFAFHDSDVPGILKKLKGSSKEDVFVSRLGESCNNKNSKAEVSVGCNRIELSKCEVKNSKRSFPFEIDFDMVAIELNQSYEDCCLVLRGIDELYQECKQFENFSKLDKSFTLSQKEQQRKPSWSRWNELKLNSKVHVSLAPRESSSGSIGNSNNVNEHLSNEREFHLTSLTKEENVRVATTWEKDGKSKFLSEDVSSEMEEMRNFPEYCDLQFVELLVDDSISHPFSEDDIILSGDLSEMSEAVQEVFFEKPPKITDKDCVPSSVSKRRKFSSDDIDFEDVPSIGKMLLKTESIVTEKVSTMGPIPDRIEKVTEKLPAISQASCSSVTGNSRYLEPFPELDSDSEWFVNMNQSIASKKRRKNISKRKLQLDSSEDEMDDGKQQQLEVPLNQILSVVIENTNFSAKGECGNRKIGRNANFVPDGTEQLASNLSSWSSTTSRGVYGKTSDDSSRSMNCVASLRQKVISGLKRSKRSGKWKYCKRRKRLKSNKCFSINASTESNSNKNCDGFYEVEPCFPNEANVHLATSDIDEENYGNVESDSRKFSPKEVVDSHRDESTEFTLEDKVEESWPLSDSNCEDDVDDIPLSPEIGRRPF